MDSSSSHNSSSGSLRFRSAPSSLLANFTDNGVDNDSVLNFQEFEDKSAARVREEAVNYSSLSQSYPGLPPHYPRQSSATSSSAMDSSYGFIGSITMGHHERVEKVHSNPARQNSSPAGLFGNLPVQNGIFFILISKLCVFQRFGNTWLFRFVLLGVSVTMEVDFLN